MRKILVSIAALLLLGGAVSAQELLTTGKTSLVLEAKKGKAPKILHYGSLLTPDEAASLKDAGWKSQNAYPAYGLAGTEECALAVTHADGNMTLDLRVEGVERKAWEGGEILSILTKDAHYPFTVKINYKSYKDQDMISTWTEITNREKKTVVLTKYLSGVLPVRVGDVWISSLYGTWANEGRVCTEKLTRGYKVIKNIDGARNSHTSHSEVMISLDGKPQESQGRVIGAALCWGGNYELVFKTNDDDFHHFLAGICPENAQYYLESKETFITPELAFTYSEEGLGGASRNFHRWGRKYKMMHGDRERKVLLNSWEGVYFDINEEGMAQMMDDIASMGGELFVMDDGWFGDKYPRTKDTSSLGDWVVDRKKLPNGIGWLVRTAADKGIKFGIWIEPEYTNSVSELYEKHPDWVLKAENRDLVYGRGGTQLVLDMSNPEVQDFVFKVVDDLMTENPDIYYIKWDANMNIRAHGSQYLKRQSHLGVAYMRGLAAVCDRVRAKYPDLTIQACASGGGRANWGILPWFDEFWVSDNTDALQRIYMQWGTSYFFPAIAMASHISATPNHTVHRTTSLKYRIDVAMSGRLGMEIQPKNMTEEEKDLCRKAIAQYKQIRPIVQFGDQYRLISPYDGLGMASMMYVSPEKDKAVYYWWKIANFYDEHFPRVRMNGLDPEAVYTIKELNRIDVKPLAIEGKSFTGRFLMEEGLEIPYVNKPAAGRSDWSSRVLYLEKK